MERTQFREACERAHAKEISFEEFLKITHPKWSEFACDIRSRWGIPVNHSTEELIHHLYFSAWTWIPRYDAKHPKAPSIDRFVVFNAFAEAKRWMRKARKSRRIEGSLEILTDEIPEVVEPTALVATSREIEWRDAVASRIQEQTQIGVRYALASFAKTESLAAAASLLYFDDEVRSVCGFASEQSARDYVKRVVMHQARRRKREAA